MKKEVRQSKIEQIINQFAVTTQDDLMARLKDAGINATQATISRDIREMQIVKQQDATGASRYMIYKAGNQNELQHLYREISETVTKYERIQFLTIVHTLPSYANMLAAILDDLTLEEVSGTLAGHDTIVLFSPDEERAQMIYDLFKQHANPDLVAE
ncbi:arginine repressor [Secundilactobacillus collinoides]|uniref:Arginine repressor n=2 Tax=Secundilactobacillus collinoides TaxID=33960 RepID=A0A0R2B8S8_SECCO|nr:ArgR family transcriptional regulator [Secundilactobacillus collinoides]KRM75758.1 arginine repressor protein [Secundilactobacillus collinoides DSM 20515 = JCM 1123]KZL42738.1 ArgR family transcriptional regulator [Secundilactobacillus collinoides]